MFWKRSQQDLLARGRVGTEGRIQEAPRLNQFLFFGHFLLALGLVVGKTDDDSKTCP